METTSLTVPSGRARLAAERRGRGPAVVFLHAGVADRRMWEPQCAALADVCTTVAYDRRGFGDSAPVDEPYAQVDDLLAVLDTVSAVEPAVLVGCSQGGRIAVDTALAHPQRVRGLVLIAPAVSGAPEQDWPDDLGHFERAFAAAEAAGDIDRLNALEAHVWLDGPYAPEGRVGGALRALFLDMNGRALRAAALGAARQPRGAWTRLEQIRVPTLVVVGTRDFPEIVARCATLARRVPGARLESVDGAAHLPNLEQPAHVNALLRGFLAGC